MMHNTAAVLMTEPASDPRVFPSPPPVTRSGGPIEWTRRDTGALLLLLGIVTVLFLDVFFGNALFLRDISRYHYPMKRIVRLELLRGEIPFWNPYHNSGQPLLANPQYQVFYPLQALILLPSYRLGFQLHVLIHLYIALIGMYLMLRDRALSTEAAAFGSLTLVLSGGYLSLFDLFPQLFSVSWWPLIALLGRRLVRRPDWRNLSLLSLSAGMVSLIGEPVTLGMTWIGTGALIVAESASWRATKGRRLIGAASLIAAAGIVALLISAVQLVPAADLARTSVRASGFSFKSSSYWSLPIGRLLEFIFPAFFGTIEANGAFYWGSALYESQQGPLIVSLYAGLIAAAMAAAGVVTRIRGWRVFLVAFIAPLLVAFGHHTPLYRLLYDIGIARLIRYPEKFAIMSVFALVIFSSYAFEGYLCGDQRLRRVALAFTAAATASGIGALIVIRTPAALAAVSRFWGAPELQSGAVVGAATHDWMAMTARAALLTAIIAVVRAPRLRNTLVALFLLIDLGPLATVLAPRTPAHFFDEPPVARQLDPDRDRYRIFHLAAWRESPRVARLGARSYAVTRNAMVPEMPSLWGFHLALEPDVDATNLKVTGDLIEAFSLVSRGGNPAAISTLLGMANCRYVAAE
jgi:hypothetical protein